MEIDIPQTQEMATPEMTWELPKESPISLKFKVGVGIANIGNNCYVNSVVQVLAHLPVIRSAL